MWKDKQELCLLKVTSRTIRKRWPANYSKGL
jgi:hypothetical protein